MERETLLKIKSKTQLKITMNKNRRKGQNQNQNQLIKKDNKANKMISKLINKMMKKSKINKVLLTIYKITKKNQIWLIKISDISFYINFAYKN